MGDLIYFSVQTKDSFWFVLIDLLRINQSCKDKLSSAKEVLFLPFCCVLRTFYWTGLCLENETLSIGVSQSDRRNVICSWFFEEEVLSIRLLFESLCKIFITNWFANNFWVNMWKKAGLVSIVIVFQQEGSKRQLGYWTQNDELFFWL